MGIAVFPVPSGSASIPSDNWVLISSGTPTNGSNAFTFSSIGTYRKMMLSWSGVGSSGYNYGTLTFNSDTGAKYNYSFETSNNGQAYGADTYIGLGNWGTTAAHNFGTLIIENTDTTGVKVITAGLNSGNSFGTQYYNRLWFGTYLASARISSISVNNPAGGGISFNGVGTISLYGVV